MPGMGAGVPLAFAVLGAFVVPWVGMWMLVPTLEATESVAVTNYRGRRVVYGLGLVWVFWVIGVELSAGMLRVLSLSLWSIVPDGSGLAGYSAPVLVLGAVALGFADDVFGTVAERGFRGHIAALRRGRLTTGGLKLFGIGLLSAAVTFPRAAFAPAGTPLLAVAGEWGLSILAIALSANFVNLTDLRPGRALKVYSAIGVVLVGLSAIASGLSGIAPALCLLLGPVVAVWRFDLGERAMLGDAGANAAGALLGWIAVQSLMATWMLASYVALMLALNLASEKISFSRVIEGNRILSWLDGLGRLPLDEADAQTAEKSSREVKATEK